MFCFILGRKQDNQTFLDWNLWKHGPKQTSQMWQWQKLTNTWCFMLSSLGNTLSLLLLSLGSRLNDAPCLGHWQLSLRRGHGDVMKMTLQFLLEMNHSNSTRISSTRADCMAHDGWHPGALLCKYSLREKNECLNSTIIYFRGSGMENEDSSTIILPQMDQAINPTVYYRHHAV